MVGKIAFMFLVGAQIYYESLWQHFFDQADKTQYSITLHAKFDFDHNSLFKSYEMPIKVESSWHYTMRAQLALLAEALKDPDNQKFIFISGDAIPLQSFAYIYQEVMKHDYSIFPYWWNHHQDPTSQFYLKARTLIGIPAHQQYINPQWVILNREHAQAMVDDTTILPLVLQTVLDNEHYPSTFLATQGRLSEVIKQEIMFVFWQSGKDSPYVFSDMHDPFQRGQIVEAIIRGKFFARKFTAACNPESIQALIDQYGCKTDAELLAN
jgi:hypothetical protein